MAEFAAQIASDSTESTVPKLQCRNSGPVSLAQMVQRFLFYQIDAEISTKPIVLQSHFVVLIHPHKAESSVACFQTADVWTELAQGSALRLSHLLASGEVTVRGFIGSDRVKTVQ